MSRRHHIDEEHTACAFHFCSHPSLHPSQHSRHFTITMTQDDSTSSQLFTSGFENGRLIRCKEAKNWKNDDRMIPRRLTTAAAME